MGYDPKVCESRFCCGDCDRCAWLRNDEQTDAEEAEEIAQDRAEMISKAERIRRAEEFWKHDD